MIKDEGDDLSGHIQKFGVCENSDNCYACTGRIIINLEECRLEEASEAYISEDETITFCGVCLQTMMLPALSYISYDPVDAFSWEPYLVITYHPDSRN